MVIPQKIKILYKDYTVIREKKKATLIHEVVHGLDDMYQIGLGEKKSI